MTEEPKKKPRKKKTDSPTKLTLAECRRRGWVAEVVEKTLPRCFIKKDLFGCIDIVAMANGTLLAIQATTGEHHADRKAKALAEPKLRQWLQCGGRFAVWSYSLRGAAGKRKLWALREEEITDHEIHLAARLSEPAAEVVAAVAPSLGSLPGTPPAAPQASRRRPSPEPPAPDVWAL